MKRTDSANWKGTGKEGKGTVSVQSKVLDNVQYSYKSRFEEGTGTNPEELIGAAHAGCYTMKLSFNISGAGYTPDNIDTAATVGLEDGAIKEINLKVQAKVPGLGKEEFDKLAEDAKENCPVSKLFTANITLETELLS